MMAFLHVIHAVFIGDALVEPIPPVVVATPVAFAVLNLIAMVIG